MKELQELKQQLDKWIENTNPKLSDEGKDKIEANASLSTLLIVRDWVTNKIINKTAKLKK